MAFDFEAYVTEQVRKQYSPPASTYGGKRPLEFAPFESALATFSDGQRMALDALLLEATVAQIQAAMLAGKLDIPTLALYYLDRIRRFDQGATGLNSVIELNPDALRIAHELEAERKRGGKGSDRPLLGIPVLLKDNIATGDRMHTTAGARALEHAQADRDADSAQRLRDSGALILGKANLSEWANFMTSTSNNGFSALGGQTRNPYGRFDVGGSSSGSAVAVAANLVALAVGSETSGSISYPSSQNSVAGIKPSAGVISGDRVIPITDAMDTLGPMARTLSDATLLFSALSGQDFSGALKGDGLDGKRIGFCRPASEVRAGDGAVFDRIEAILKAAGATLIAVTVPDETVDYLPVLHMGMKFGLDAWLRDTHTLPATLGEIIRFNAADPANRAPYGQDLLEKTEGVTATLEEYRATAESNRATCQAIMDGLLSDHGVDLLVSLSNYLSGLYAPAGCPLVTVPAGYRESGEPIGVAFVGTKGSDRTLIQAGFGFESAARLRASPANFEGYETR